MADWMTGNEGKNRFMLLNSPPASGKTSLLILFQQKYPHLNAVYFSLKEDSDPLSSLARFGLDIRRRTCAYEHVIYMLDDAQYRYDTPSFWDVLIKDAPLYFGDGVRFLISVTHVISTRDQASPAHFRDLETISRGDLILSDEQTLELLSSPPPLGLSTCTQPFSELKSAIMEHCNGIIGAVCQCLSFYADHFRHREPTEVECVRAFYSKGFLEQTDHCFGTVDPSRFSIEVNAALLKCVLGERIHSTRQADQPLSGVLASFAQAGILNIDAQNYFVFSSLLAKQFFTHRYFPLHADKDLSNLRELVMNAIRSMSTMSLSSSTSSREDFSKETTLRQEFTLGLLSNTTFNTAICPELSRSFATNTGAQKEIDFFVGGDRMWGIELVRCGAENGEHISRFGPEGKYAGLQSSDYVVLEFRKGVASVRQEPHKATASFPINAAGHICVDSVVVKYGNDEAVTLHLQP